MSISLELTNTRTYTHTQKHKILPVIKSGVFLMPKKGSRDRGEQVGEEKKKIFFPNFVNIFSLFLFSHYCHSRCHCCCYNQTLVYRLICSTNTLYFTLCYVSMCARMLHRQAISHFFFFFKYFRLFFFFLLKIGNGKFDF